MKKIFFILLILFTTSKNTAFAQSNGKAKVTYNIEFRSGIPTTADAVLFFNDSISQYYVSNHKEISKSNSSEEIIIESTNSNLEIVETNFYTQEIKIVDNLLDKTYLVTERLKKIDWQITIDTKKIGNLNCIKAVGLFRGSTYTVYFAPEIKTSFGPWKLNGLPGLIIEVTESRNRLGIYLKEIDVSNKAHLFLEYNINKNKTPITLKEYVEMMSNIDLVLFEKIKSQLPRGIVLYERNPVEDSEKVEVFDESDF